uniref:Apple domain-containing protein n=1 Tax=Tetranychus urticae TaxID=32264 RepID=T1KP38_TETUR
MLFSLLNERNKMLFILSNVVILLSTIKTASAADLVNLPLRIPSKSVNINATLSDSNGANKYFIQESISASGKNIAGKIVISGEKDSYNVYYTTAPNLNKNRLVIYGTNCLVFTFKNNWDETLHGIGRPVTNLVLLMGPSILYRLVHSSIVWKAVADKNIRGTMMKGATTEINGRLKITYYYKKHFDDDTGIKHPSRIEFSGYDPYSTSYSNNENLILDIYLQNENYYDQLANEVQPLPGIGCPYYLPTKRPSFPGMKTDYVHYTMYEYIKGSTTSRTFSEIHASRKFYLLRLKATLLGVTTEAIYDYNLGVSYLFEEGGGCRTLPADSNSPGISSYGYFNLKSLFLFDSSYEYLGKINLEHRSGFPVDAWETIRYDININGKKVDKAVITQYFVESHDSEIFYGYTLVSTTIAIYKLDSSKKTYTLTDEITRDYMNFEQAGSEDELHDIFSLKDCKYLTSDKTLTLAFKLQREDIFNSLTMSVSADTFKKMKKIQASTEFECLDKLSKSQDTINVVIYRPSDFSCGYLKDFDDLKEDTKIGDPCSIYHFPLHNLHRIDQEIPLDQIHNTFLKDVGKLYPLISEYNGKNFSAFSCISRTVQSYKLIDVIDKTKNQDNSAGNFQSRIKVDEKLKSNDQVTVIVPDAKTFADCYRTCHNSEQLECNTFSFCSNGDCRVSSLLTVDLYNTSHIEQDKSCSIHALNAINDYLEVPARKFKTQTSVAVDKDAYSCAEYCHASLDCFSFQWCDFQCSFGGFYTDAATEYDGECSVYHPKVSEKYQKTGNKIVSDVLYTEMNLNFDQCASLCHGWSDGDTGCKSFNYCPKSRTESSCSLTQFSVKSSNTKTIEGGDCSNYELKVESTGKKRKESSSIAQGTSGSGAFGIIMLFLFVGALLGFAAPFGYTKVKQMRNASTANESFTWTRQVNEGTENIN